MDFSQINYFFKHLLDFRETINIADFFFMPHVVHINELLANDFSGVHEQRIFEISLLLTGKMIYNVKGRDIPLQPGDIIIIPPNTVHSWHVLEDDSGVFNFMVNISRHGDNSRRDLVALNESIRKHRYHIKAFAAFENIIRQIVAETIEQKAASQEKVLYLMRIAFIELIRKLLPDVSGKAFPRNFPPVRGENKKDIAEMVHFFIQDNIDRPITLEEISNYIGLSIGHLNFLFKNETHITINQAIISKRLEWACRYLKQTDRQIKDIATLLGYNDINYFYLQFKKKYGMTPSKYRNNT